MAAWLLQHPPGARREPPQASAETQPWLGWWVVFSCQISRKDLSGIWWSLLHLGKFTTPPQDAHLREDLKQFFRIGFLDFVSKSLKMWNLHQFLFWAIQRGAKRSRKRMVYLILVSLVWRGPDWPAKCGEPEHSLNKKNRHISWGWWRISIGPKSLDFLSFVCIEKVMDFFQHSRPRWPRCERHEKAIAEVTRC